MMRLDEQPVDAVSPVRAGIEDTGNDDAIPRELALSWGTGQTLPVNLAPRKPCCVLAGRRVVLGGIDAVQADSSITDETTVPVLEARDACDRRVRCSS